MVVQNRARRRQRHGRAGPRVADQRLADAAPLAGRGARGRRVPRAAARGREAVGGARQAARACSGAARRWRRRACGGRGIPTALPDREQAFLDAVVQLGTRAQRAAARRPRSARFALLSAVVAGGIDSRIVQVQRAERATRCDKADVASREATRARQAEDRVTEQLDVIKREQAAKAAAETAVERGKQDLRAANADLQKALTRRGGVRACAERIEARPGRRGKGERPRRVGPEDQRPLSRSCSPTNARARSARERAGEDRDSSQVARRRSTCANSHAEHRFPSITTAAAEAARRLHDPRRLGPPPRFRAPLLFRCDAAVPHAAAPPAPPTPGPFRTPIRRNRVGAVVPPSPRCRPGPRILLARRKSGAIRVGAVDLCRRRRCRRGPRTARI